MFDIYKDKDKKVHFVGIGGISMSGLAEILIYYGYKVSGSDRTRSHLTDKLQNLGAQIFIGHDSNNLVDVDIVVYTAAVKEDNPEIVKAKELGLLLFDRAEFLGLMMKKFEKAIAISGSHGKTTATSMLSLVLLNAGLDPTILVGGEVDQIGGNAKPGKSPYFIAEACEYKGSFLKFFPYIGIILNIDADHLDYYKDINEIYNTFRKFAALIPKDGTLIGCIDDEKVKKIINDVPCNKITFGLKKGDFCTSKIEHDSMGCSFFRVLYKGSYYGEFKLSVPGEHNIINALATISCCHLLGLKPDEISKQLSKFRGTHRRFEKKGEIDGVVVIDDYAHHPTEIMATIKAAVAYPHKRLLCIFQPHTYTRTTTLFKEFTTAFDGVDKLILADIYAAREKDTGIVNSRMLCDAICERNIDALYLGNFNNIKEYLRENLRAGDVVITMGAGDVYKVGEELLLTK